MKTTNLNLSSILSTLKILAVLLPLCFASCSKPVKEKIKDEFMSYAKDKLEGVENLTIFSVDSVYMFNYEKEKIKVDSCVIHIEQVQAAVKNDEVTIARVISIEEISLMYGRKFNSRLSKLYTLVDEFNKLPNSILVIYKISYCHNRKDGNKEMLALSNDGFETIEFLKLDLGEWSKSSNETVKPLGLQLTIANLCADMVKLCMTYSAALQVLHTPNSGSDALYRYCEATLTSFPDDPTEK